MKALANIDSGEKGQVIATLSTGEAANQEVIGNVKEEVRSIPYRLPNGDPTDDVNESKEAWTKYYGLGSTEIESPEQYREFIGRKGKAHI